MWTVCRYQVGNPARGVESSLNDVDDRPANVGELGSMVDVAARRGSAPFHNM